MSEEKYYGDLEKEPVGTTTYHESAVPGESFEYGDSTYAKLQRLAGKFKVEQRGIERVPEDERDDHSLLNVGTMVSSKLQASDLALTLRSGYPPTWWSPRSQSES